VEDSGVLKLTGVITDFSIWDDAIHLFAVKFYNQYNVYPNILLANNSTYRKIDLYAQMHPDRIRIYDDDSSFETIETSNEPYNGLSHFATEDYELECCMDYDLQEGYFTLIFDEVPDFDGESVEKPEEKENIYTYRKIA
jgi:hypothetical protein